MQDVVDRRGASRRQYSGAVLFQHWYQKVNPRARARGENVPDHQQASPVTCYRISADHLPRSPDQGSHEARSSPNHSVGRDSASPASASHPISTFTAINLSHSTLNSTTTEAIVAPSTTDATYLSSKKIILVVLSSEDDDEEEIFQQTSRGCPYSIDLKYRKGTQGMSNKLHNRIWSNLSKHHRKTNQLGVDAQRYRTDETTPG